MKTINRSKLPEIPQEIAVCPICGEPIVIDDIDEWESETGRVTECGLHINCVTEPDDPNDHNWWNWHYQMPYVDWLPVQQRVYQWFDQNFRIDVTGYKHY